MSILSALSRRFSLSLLIVDGVISVDVGNNAKRFVAGVSIGPGFVALNRNGDIARFYGRDLAGKLPARVRDFHFERDFGNTVAVREARREAERAYEREEMLSGIYSADEEAPATLRYA